MHGEIAHYQKELDRVHQLVEAFADKHPKIATRLKLEKKNIADPEIANLFQTFALSNARVAHSLDDEYSFVSDSLLNAHHPHLCAPLPAFSIIEFKADESKLNAKVQFDRHHLLTNHEYEDRCLFKTIYPVTLFPIKITEAELVQKPAAVPIIPAIEKSESFLRLRLEGLKEKIDFSTLGIEFLGIFINLPLAVGYKLYELIFTHTVSIVISKNKNDVVILQANSLQSVGFGEEEGVLSYSPSTPIAYRLLTEFFSYPEKFLFFDIKFLSQSLAKLNLKPRDSIDIIFYLNKFDHELQKTISSESFKLGCTPIIHLNEAYALEKLARQDNPKLDFYENKKQTIKEIALISKLRLPRRRFLEQGIRWRYISAFNLNSFSLSNNEEGVRAFSHLLEVFLPEKTKNPLLSGIMGIRTEKATVRHQNQLAQGINITLEIEKSAWQEGFYILKIILEKFFMLYFSKNCNINLNISLI